METALKFPEVRRPRNRDGHKDAFINAEEYFNKDFPIERLGIPEIKGYRVLRQGQGAGASTIDKEHAAPSMMFRVLMEMGLVSDNRARKVRYLSENGTKSGVNPALRFHDLRHTWKTNARRSCMVPQTSLEP